MALQPSSSYAGPSTTTQTSLVNPQQRRLSRVNTGVVGKLPAQSGIKPDDLFHEQAELFPKPERAKPDSANVKPLQQLELDDDSKYIISFKSDGYATAPDYVERPALMARLCEFLEQGPTTIRRTAFLLGPSGNGKTQIATRYAQDSSEAKKYSAIFHVDAKTKSTLQQSMASILDDQLWESWPITERARPETRPDDSKEVRELIHWWLSLPKNRRWLIVFDNADDPDLVLDYLPPKKANHGAVIITSQRDEIFSARDFLEKNFKGGRTETIPVSGLDLDEAKTLVTKIAGPAIMTDLGEAGKSVMLPVSACCEEFGSATDGDDRQTPEKSSSFSNAVRSRYPSSQKAYCILRMLRTNIDE
jgi:hypothetical protein